MAEPSSPAVASMPERATKEKIRQLAEWMIQGKVWHTGMVPDGLIGVCFMPIGLGGLAGYTDEMLEQLVFFGVVGEDDGPRAINDCPIFSTVRVWYRDDWMLAVERMRAAQQALEVGS